MHVSFTYGKNLVPLFHHHALLSWSCIAIVRPWNHLQDLKKLNSAVITCGAVFVSPPQRVFFSTNVCLETESCFQAAGIYTFAQALRNITPNIPCMICNSCPILRSKTPRLFLFKIPGILEYFYSSMEVCKKFTRKIILKTWHVINT